MGALDGVRVLEFSHFIAGPHCGQILADHGAEVIKVEPTEGEFSRYGNPMYNSTSLYFPTMNRNKRGIALDLKSPEGKEIIRELISKTDIVITNYATGVPERLGISYNELSSINPRIIMVHITGFGLTGPYRNRSAFDGILQAMGGLAHMTGETDGPPMRVGHYIADHLAAFQGAIGALLALNSQKTTGKGQLVDVSMLDGMISILNFSLNQVSVLKESPTRTGNRTTNVFSTIFKSRDGYIVLAAITDKLWKSFCEVIGNEEWSNENSKFGTTDGRLENYDELENLVNEWTQERTNSELIEMLLAKNIPCGPVYTIEDIMNDPHIKQRQMVVPIEYPNVGRITVPGTAVKLNGTPSREPQVPPQLGENTREILKDIGYSEDVINKLDTSGVIKCMSENKV